MGRTISGIGGLVGFIMSNRIYGMVGGRLVIRIYVTELLWCNRSSVEERGAKDP